MPNVELLDLAQRIAARPQGRELLELLADAGEDADAFLEGALRIYTTARPHETPAWKFLGLVPRGPLAVLEDPDASKAELRFAERTIRGARQLW